nr:flippase activity-associated protein Agl23 [Herpetosiphon giganteus]
MIATSSRQVAVPRTQRRRFTVEHLAYIGLGLLSVLMHLWALGGRSLHHDETIHAYYSWLLYRGDGYLHDPLTHGPFLYYWTALQYFLFGDNEFTARLAAATFGIALTLTPWLLRKNIGRGTALMMAGYLLISPVTLYVGRFIRHDIFAVTQEIICLIAIVRYISTRHVRWIYIFFASFALMFVTIETSYLFTLTLGSFIVLVTLWQVNRKLLILFGVYGLLAVACLKGIPDHRGLVVSGSGNPAPVLDANGKEQWLPLPLVTESQALIVRNQGDDLFFDDTANGGLRQGYFSKLRETLFGISDAEAQANQSRLYHQVKNQTLYGNNGVFMHMPITALTILTVVFLIAVIVIIWFYKGKDQTQTMWKRAVSQAPERSLLPALDSLWGMHGALAVVFGLVIYAAFFTSFGVHPVGVVSGIAGSLLYWVAQHDVERGGQPSHYYFVQLLVYEPLLLFAGFAATIAGIGHLALQIKRGAALTAQRMAPGLLAWWAAGSFALYSWAGEKMPWITLHVAVPLIFIAAWGIGRVFAWGFQPIQRAWLSKELPTRRTEWLGLVSYLAVIGLVASYAVMQLTRMVRIQPNIAPTGSPATPMFLGSMILIVLAITGFYSMFHGWRRAVTGLTLALTIIWSMYSFRSAWRLNYQNGDIPVEMLVYVQSSPDVGRVMDDLRKVSIAETGRMELPIMYDNEQIWKWYVREYTKATGFSGSMNSPATPETAAILMIDSNWTTNQANVEGFLEGRFPLRWWFPESQFYRFAEVPELDANGQTMRDSSGEQMMQPAPYDQDSTIGRLIRNPFDAKTQNELWRYLLFRQPPAQLSSVDFKVYVRPRYAHVLGVQTQNMNGQSQVR